MRTTIRDSIPSAPPCARPSGAMSRQIARRRRFGPRPAICAALACATLLALPATGAARTAYDGYWSVTATSTAGSCGSFFRFPLAVINGRVVSSGVAGVSGRVTQGGAVSVSVRQGNGMVFGAGRLGRSWGTGRWTSRSASGRCAGSWQAQRGG